MTSSGRCNTDDDMSQLKSFASACRKIIGVGRNFRDHAKELGNEVPTEPLLFMKPPSCIIQQGQAIEIPVGCWEIHHEIELGVVVGRGGKMISRNRAMDHVGGYVLALDMTARDFQAKAKKAGHPWAMAKAFDTSCPVSRLLSQDDIGGDPDRVKLTCSVNGEVRQDASTELMIFKIPDIISYASTYFALEEGDLILMGTPAGVGPVKEGDVIEGEIPGVVKFDFPVKQR